ncbi:MAG TPA: LuxR C-terminal-related transcriptional regulator, partial [Thermomicrobiales bacterium]|nr:LuxR C-terminal-related transcriptional regulator [Thermomicrobiales bacterium]
ESLERGNLFLVALDDTRLWYRYHHLFAEVLRAYAMEHPDQVAAQHRRASEWYARHDLPDEAIGHALAAGDVARASDLIELAATAMRRNRQEATLLGWLRSLPIEVFRSRPVLSAVFGGVLLSCGQPDGVEERLRDAEQWLDTADDFHVRPEASPSGMIVVDDDEFRRLPGAIVVYRSGQSLAQGDVAGTMHYARRALELVPEADHLYRGAAASLLGLASWASGDLETAYGSYAEGMTRLRKAGYIADTIGGALALADIRIAQGRLRDAMSTCQDALRQAAAQGTPALRGTADMYVAMSELSLERNDLNAAMQYLVRSAEQGEHTGFPQHPWRWRVAMARIREARGDRDGAIDLLIEAERLYVSDMFPNVRPLAAQKARLWIAQGNLADAMGWVRECNLSVEDPLTYLREYEHITLARVLVVRFRSDREHTSAIDEAMGLLEHLQEAAKTGNRTGSEIEILVLLALAHEARGDIPRSLPPLERALALAEPEDYVRLFVAEGPQMARLLSEALKRGIMPGYTSRLLAAIGGGTPGGDHPRASHVPGVVEPLSQRELEVLRLIAQGLSNHEIGERLYLALSTVKGHNRVIFAKLDVQRRTEAVARARELGLL